MKIKSREFLNRFTSLPVLIDMLTHKRLTLLSPDTWEDRNDAHYMSVYKKRRGMKTVLALCFSMSRETFHHWKVFSDGSGGVCVEFNKSAILASLSEDKDFRHEPIVYKSLKEIGRLKPKPADLPFLKRSVFSDEREFRILYRTKHREEKTKDLPFSLSSIRKITLSPWMPETVADSVMELIQSIEGCSKLSVNHSKLIESPTWKAAIQEIEKAT